MNRSIGSEQILEPRKKQPVLYPLRHVFSVILLAGVLPWLISLAVRVRFGDVPHEQEPLHESVELVGSCIALGVTLLLALRLRHERTSPHLLWVVAALVAMGLVDGVHAVVPFGIAWSWLRHGATLIGGVLFALVWLPVPAVAASRPLWFTAGLTGLAIAASLAVWYDPAWLPAP
ncbi:MAG: hypothetical protein ACXV7J_01055 [Methylomonas sp.]